MQVVYLRSNDRIVEEIEIEMQLLQMGCKENAIAFDYVKPSIHGRLYDRICSHIHVLDRICSNAKSSILFLEDSVDDMDEIATFLPWLANQSFDICLLDYENPNPNPNQNQINHLIHGQIARGYILRQSYLQRYITLLQDWLSLLQQDTETIFPRLDKEKDNWIGLRKNVVAKREPILLLSNSFVFPLPSCRKHCGFYCLSFESPKAGQTMIQRFAKCDHLLLEVSDGVPHTDPRLALVYGQSDLRRLWSCTYGHLDNLQRFLQSGYRYAFLCENDVHLHHSFADHLPQIVDDFEEMELDILLLGYMTLDDFSSSSSSSSSSYHSYHRYESDLWGMHLAMFSRNYAATLLRRYGSASGYAAETLIDSTKLPFSPDWILTKEAAKNKRALRYPMLAVEEGNGHYDDLGQRAFHQANHAKHYNPQFFY